MVSYRTLERGAKMPRCKTTSLDKRYCYCLSCDNRRKRNSNNAQRDSKGFNKRKDHDTKGKNNHGRRF